MGILPYMVLCNAALCVFHISLLKVALSKVFDPDIEMKGEIWSRKNNLMLSFPLLQHFGSPLGTEATPYCSLSNTNV